VLLAALKARRALRVSSVQPRIAKAAGIDRRVLHGALSRLEPGAGKLARRVLRGGVGRKVRPLPAYAPSLRSPWRAADDPPDLRPRWIALHRCPPAAPHQAASRLLASGSSLKEVADVLHHRSLNTTLIYAKLDTRSLSTVALPWPGDAK